MQTNKMRRVNVLNKKILHKRKQTLFFLFIGQKTPIGMLEQKQETDACGLIL